MNQEILDIINELKELLYMGINPIEAINEETHTDKIKNILSRNRTNPSKILNKLIKKLENQINNYLLEDAIITIDTLEQLIYTHPL